MQVINLFSENKGLSYLKNIYKLSDVTMGNVLRNCFEHRNILPEVKGNSFLIFLKETGIHPDTFDLSHIKIRCAHITSSIDKGESIKKYGLVPVTMLLSHNSVLSGFLNENGVQVGVSSRTINVGKMKYDLSSFGDSWSQSHLLNVSRLESVLYNDCGEVEVFVSADERTMMDYSTVSHYPEILYTINAAIMELTGEDLSLGFKWESLKKKVIKVEFDVALDEFSYIGGLRNSNDDYNIIYEAEDYLEKKYYDTDVPDLFWKNEWIIRRCLCNFCSYDGLDEVYAGIKSDVVLSPDRLNLITI